MAKRTNTSWAFSAQRVATTRLPHDHVSRRQQMRAFADAGARSRRPKATAGRSAKHTYRGGKYENKWRGRRDSKQGGGIGVKLDDILVPRAITPSGVLRTHGVGAYAHIEQGHRPEKYGSKRRYCVGGDGSSVESVGEARTAIAEATTALCDASSAGKCARAKSTAVEA